MRYWAMIITSLVIVLLILLSLFSLQLGFTTGTSRLLSILVIIIGVFLALAGLISSIKRNSPPKITGGISRAEFYGVVVVIFGWTQMWVISMNSRIDQIFQMMIK